MFEARHLGSSLTSCRHCRRLGTLLNVMRQPSLPVIAISVAFIFYCNPRAGLWLLLGLFSWWVANGGHRWLRYLALNLKRDTLGLFFIIRGLFIMRRHGRRGDTVASIFEETAKKNRNKPAFICEDVTWTFNDVSRYSSGVAHFLSEKSSLKQGDAVALFMESRCEYVGLWLGVGKIGGVAALINFNQRNNSLLHSIKAANSKAIICGEELLPALAEVAKDLHKDLPIFVVPKSEGPPSTPVAKKPTIAKVDGISFETLDLSALEQYINMGPFKSPPGDFHGIVLYIYTSGTTGLPKAAKISSSRFWLMAAAPHYLPGLTENEVVYVSLPIYHSNGGIIGVGQALICGCTVVIRKKFSASQFWDDCVKYNCTAFCYIGEICRYMLAQPKRPSESQHKVRFAIGNGLRQNIWREFKTRFNIEHIVEFYGSTEGSANAINYCDVEGAVGFLTRVKNNIYPISLIKVDDAGNPIRDKETGFCIGCEPGESGELVGRITSRSYQPRFDGYASKQETEKKILRDVFNKGDSFFRSGDILQMDELGYLYFLDRTGDTFRWRGENVSTQEVEGAVSTAIGHERDVAVYGVEVPGVEGRAGMTAIVDPKNDLDITNGLAGTLSKSLPAYAVPVFIRVMTEIPSTGTYKFVKTSLQKEGFDPEKVAKDPLYYLDMTSAQRRYAKLTPEIHKKIITGEIRF